MKYAISKVVISMHHLHLHFKDERLLNEYFKFPLYQEKDVFTFNLKMYTGLAIDHTSELHKLIVNCEHYKSICVEHHTFQFSLKTFQHNVTLNFCVENVVNLQSAWRSAKRDFNFERSDDVLISNEFVIAHKLHTGGVSIDKECKFENLIVR